MLLGFLLGIAFRLFLIIFVWSECEWALSSAVGSLFASLGGLGERKKRKRAGDDGKGSSSARLLFFDHYCIFIAITQREPLRTREVDKVKFIYYGKGSMKMLEGLWKIG